MKMSKSVIETNIITMLLVLLAVCTLGETFAMKRAGTGDDAGSVYKKQKTEQAVERMEEELSPMDPYSFKRLPIEIKGEIFLKIAQIADSIANAAENMKSYAFKLDAHKELAQLLNNSEFCLRIIKNLSARFERSNMAVLIELNKVLKVEELKRREKLQEDFKVMCTYRALTFFDRPFSLDEFEEIYKQGIDLEFTEGHVIGSKKYMLTPLGVSVVNINTKAVEFLINHGANVNNQDPMMQGTPLMYAILQYRGLLFPYEKKAMKIVIQMLLDAGADPEIVGKNGMTALELAQTIQDKSIALLLESDIEKKRAKK